MEELLQSLLSKQQQLALKQAELLALEDIPENAEARSLLQSEIETLENEIIAIEASIAQLETPEGVQTRIEALGDIALLIDQLFQSNAANLRDNDSWNPCGFCANHIDTNFGWIFEVIPKPTLLELEAIKASLQE